MLKISGNVEGDKICDLILRIFASESNQNLKAKILEYESSGYKCIGFGAAAKGQISSS